MKGLDQMMTTPEHIEQLVTESRDRATAIELNRWKSAMEEFGFKPHPGLSVKENLAAFGDWWAHRKATGN